MTLAPGEKVVFVASGRVVQGILLVANPGSARWAVAVAPGAIGDITPRRVLRAGGIEFAVSDLATDILSLLAEDVLQRLYSETGTDAVGFALESINLPHAQAAYQTAIEGGFISGIGDSPQTAISVAGSYVFAGGPPAPTASTSPQRPLSSTLNGPEAMQAAAAMLGQAGWGPHGGPPQYAPQSGSLFQNPWPSAPGQGLGLGGPPQPARAEGAQPAWHPMNFSPDSSQDSDSSAPGPTARPPPLLAQGLAKGGKKKKAKVNPLAVPGQQGSSGAGYYGPPQGMAGPVGGQAPMGAQPQMDPSLFIQFEMLKALKQMQKRSRRSKSSDGSSDSSSDEDAHSRGSPMRAAFRLRRRVRKRPLKIVARYRERSLARLGIHAMSDGTLTSPFAHRMTSEKLRPTFGKMVGLWRAHYGLSEVLELLEQKRTEEAAATVVQLLKSLHQAVIDGGNWTLASSLLPWEDPLGRDVFGGDENELAAAAAWTKSVRELQSQVLKLTSGNRPDISVEAAEDNSLLTSAERKRLAKAKAKAARPAPPTNA